MTNQGVISHPGQSGGDLLVRAVQMLPKRPQEAERLLRDVLRSRPDDLNAPLFLARALRVQRKTNDAIDVLQSLRKAHPNFAPVHYEFGMVCMEMGRREQAIDAVRAALKIEPALSNAWLVLGDLLFDAAERVGADQAYMEHIRRSADAPHIEAAMAALRAGNMADAEDVMRQHLRKLPGDVAALAVLGEALARGDEFREAEALLSRCVERAPSFLHARQNLATILFRQLRGREALAHIEILLKHDADDPAYRELHANTLGQFGEVEEARRAYEALIHDFPDNVKSWINFGHFLRGIGQSDEALAAYRQAIALAPLNGDAYWAIANLKSAPFTQSEIDSMRNALAESDLKAEDRAHFHFALAKALEDNRFFEESFGHYCLGNTIRAKADPYDIGVMRELVSKIKSVYTPEFLAQFANCGAEAADPIFIVGLPRSGSTLVEQILASHSAVEGTSELPDVQSVMGEFSEWLVNDSLADRRKLSGEMFKSLGDAYISATRRHRKTGKPFFTDKMPGNFLRAGLIHLTLSNAKIIDIRRQPLACCFSNFKQSFASGQTFTYDLETLGHYYALYVDLMAHFDSVLPGRVHRVFHEDLVADPNKEIGRLLEYCALPFEPGCLAFHQTKRQVRTVSSEQVRRPIFADGVDHWRNYEPWLGPLKKALGPVLDTYPPRRVFLPE